MNKKLTFHEKVVAVKLSPQAVKQSEQLDCALLIEIQIYFSCLLGKRLAFYSSAEIDGVWQVESQQFAGMLQQAEQLSENIFVRFNTVMTKACPVSDYVGPPPVTDFTISNQKPYVPNWLMIDFKNDQWSGEYGWQASKVGQGNTKQVRAQAQRAGLLV